MYSKVLILLPTLILRVICEENQVMCSSCDECGGSSSILAVPLSGESTIYKYAFMHCTTLINVIVADGVTAIEYMLLLMLIVLKTFIFQKVLLRLMNILL